MGESIDYAGIKKDSQIKRIGNLNFSTNYLTEIGVTFESKNNGIHLIVNSKNGIIDFYPTTGLWIVRNGKRGRGVKNMVNFMGVSRDAIS